MQLKQGILYCNVPKPITTIVTWWLDNGLLKKWNACYNYSWVSTNLIFLSTLQELAKKFSGHQALQSPAV